MAYPPYDLRVYDVQVRDETLSVELRDGRTIRAPLHWFPRLERASSQQRSQWFLRSGDLHIYWPKIDQNVSVEKLLRTPTSAPKKQRLRAGRR